MNKPIFTVFLVALYLLSFIDLLPSLELSLDKIANYLDRIDKTL